MMGTDFFDFLYVNDLLLQIDLTRVHCRSAYFPFIAFGQIALTICI